MKNTWPEEIKELLVSAHVFAKQSNHDNITTALVLSFALEKYYGQLKNCIKDFFQFKHNILKEAVKQTGIVIAQDNFEDSLIMTIHLSLKERSPNEFITQMVKIKGGEIIKPIKIF